MHLAICCCVYETSTIFGLGIFALSGIKSKSRMKSSYNLQKICPIISFPPELYSYRTCWPSLVSNRHKFSVPTAGLKRHVIVAYGVKLGHSDDVSQKRSQCERKILKGSIMQINWVIVRIFGALVVLLHLTVAMLLLFALYAKSDPETAARIVQSIEWYRLLNPSFEMILALIFFVYVILVGSLSVLLNISKRMDESSSILGEIRDLLKNQNSR